MTGSINDSQNSLSPLKSSGPVQATKKPEAIIVKMPSGSSFALPEVFSTGNKAKLMKEWDKGKEMLFRKNLYKALDGKTNYSSISFTNSLEQNAQIVSKITALLNPQQTHPFLLGLFRERVILDPDFSLSPQDFISKSKFSIKNFFFSNPNRVGINKQIDTKKDFIQQWKNNKLDQASQFDQIIFMGYFHEARVQGASDFQSYTKEDGGGFQRFQEELDKFLDEALSLNSKWIYTLTQKESCNPKLEEISAFLAKESNLPNDLKKSLKRKLASKALKKNNINEAMLWPFLPWARSQTVDKKPSGINTEMLRHIAEVNKKTDFYLPNSKSGKAYYNEAFALLFPQENLETECLESPLNLNELVSDIGLNKRIRFAYKSIANFYQTALTFDQEEWSFKEKINNDELFENVFDALPRAKKARILSKVIAKANSLTEPGIDCPAISLIANKYQSCKETKAVVHELNEKAAFAVYQNIYQNSNKNSLKENLKDFTDLYPKASLLRNAAQMFTGKTKWANEAISQNEAEIFAQITKLLPASLETEIIIDLNRRLLNLVINRKMKTIDSTDNINASLKYLNNLAKSLAPRRQNASDSFAAKAHQALNRLIKNSHANIEFFADRAKNEEARKVLVKLINKDEYQTAHGILEVPANAYTLFNEFILARDDIVLSLEDLDIDKAGSIANLFFYGICKTYSPHQPNYLEITPCFAHEWSKNNLSNETEITKYLLTLSMSSKYWGGEPRILKHNLEEYSKAFEGFLQSSSNPAWRQDLTEGRTQEQLAVMRNLNLSDDSFKARFSKELKNAFTRSINDGNIFRRQEASEQVGLLDGFIKSPQLELSLGTTIDTIGNFTSYFNPEFARELCNKFAPILPNDETLNKELGIEANISKKVQKLTNTDPNTALRAMVNTYQMTLSRQDQKNIFYRLLAIIPEKQYCQIAEDYMEKTWGKAKAGSISQRDVLGDELKAVFARLASRLRHNNISSDMENLLRSMLKRLPEKIHDERLNITVDYQKVFLALADKGEFANFQTIFTDTASQLVSQSLYSNMQDCLFLKSSSNEQVAELNRIIDLANEGSEQAISYISKKIDNFISRNKKHKTISNDVFKAIHSKAINEHSFFSTEDLIKLFEAYNSTNFLKIAISSFKDNKYLKEEEVNFLHEYIKQSKSIKQSRDERRQLYQYILQLANYRKRINNNELQLKELVEFMSQVISKPMQHKQKYFADLEITQEDPNLKYNWGALEVDELKMISSIRPKTEFLYTLSETNRKKMNNKIALASQGDKRANSYVQKKYQAHKKQEANVEFNANINSFKTFIRNFSSLPSKMQSLITKPVKARWDILTKTKATANHKQYQAINDHAFDIMTEMLLKNTGVLSSEDVSKIKESFSKHPEAWHRDGFLASVINYFSFSNEVAQESVQKLLRLLANSDVVEVKINDKKVKAFRNLPKEHIFKDFANLADSGFFDTFNSDHSTSLKLKADAQSYKHTYKTTLSNFKTHTQTKDLSLEQASSKLRSQFKSQSQFDEFWQIYSKIIDVLENDTAISESETRDLKNKFRRLELNEVFGDDNANILTDFDKLIGAQVIKAKIESSKNKELVMDINFAISKDPILFLLISAIQPHYTCQRIIENTGHNNHGIPVNRVRQTHFTLAHAFVDGKFAIRSVLEIAKAKTGQATKPILLVEQRYSDGQVPDYVFRDQILSWALKNNIEYVKFADYNPPESISTTVDSIDLLEGDGDVYRDTFVRNSMPYERVLDVKEWAKAKVKKLTKASEESKAKAKTNDADEPSKFRPIDSYSNEEIQRILFPEDEVPMQQNYQMSFA